MMPLFDALAVIAIVGGAVLALCGTMQLLLMFTRVLFGVPRL